MGIVRQTCFLLLMWGGMVYGQKADVSRLTPLDADEALSDTARLEWVKHFASNTASSVDLVTDAAMDASGFVFVTGKSEGSEGGRDYLTVKFSPLGQEVWRAQYDGPAHADDIPSALALDAAGNVYVTGTSAGADLMGNPTSDYATIKYNSAGQQQWVERYGYVWGGVDRAVAIAVDVNGSVYVTGESSHADSSTYRALNQDFATIKYNTNGVQQWVRRYNGPKISDDAATALVLDDSCNVYVTGSSEIHSANPWSWRAAVTTLKYNSDGVEQWAANIEHDSTYYSAAGIALDRSGGVYVTGRVAGLEYWTGPKLFVARINAAGQGEWIRAHDSLSGVTASLAVDPSGNVLVAGVRSGYGWWSGQGDFMQMMKYNATGDLLWARQYRDQQDALVKVSDMVVDRLGNAYATGSSGQWYMTMPFMGDSIVTLKYDANGVPQWVEHYRGAADSKNEASAVLVDVVGNVFVVGASGFAQRSDFLTVKYQPSGNEEWDAHATGEGTSFESVSDMTLDAAGNVYITGSNLDAITSYDYFTVKFNPQGDQLWKATYNGPTSRGDHSNAITLDRVGNVYVTGSSDGAGTSRDWATIKYNSSGIQQWVARYNGQSNQDDEGHLVVVDSALNVYVAGATASGSRLTTIKYNVFGLQQWAASYDSASFVAMPGGLCIDRNGNVYVTNPMWYWADAIAFKYNSLGDEVWRVPGGNEILVDDSANVYVTAIDVHFGLTWTAKYSPSGVPIWIVNAGGSDMEFDSSGDILFHRYAPSSSGKITRGGAIQWHPSTWPAIDASLGFCVDASGGSYVSGLSYSVSPVGCYTVKNSSAGTTEWVTRYDTENDLVFTPQSARVDASGNLYVAGTSEKNDFSQTATVLKYAQIMVSVREDGSALPGAFSLSQNYPNPFNPGTTIRFALPKSGHVELKVYNTLGQEVATLVNEEKTAGTYSAQWNASSVASGVYFYRLKAGEYTETKKLLLMK